MSCEAEQRVLGYQLTRLQTLAELRLHHTFETGLIHRLGLEISAETLLKLTAESFKLFMLSEQVAAGSKTVLVIGPGRGSCCFVNFF